MPFPRPGALFALAVQLTVGGAGRHRRFTAIAGVVDRCRWPRLSRCRGRRRRLVAWSLRRRPGLHAAIAAARAASGPLFIAGASLLRRPAARRRPPSSSTRTCGVWNAAPWRAWCSRATRACRPTGSRPAMVTRPRRLRRDLVYAAAADPNAPRTARILGPFASTCTSTRRPSCRCHACCGSAPRTSALPAAVVRAQPGRRGARPCGDRPAASTRRWARTPSG